MNAQMQARIEIEMHYFFVVNRDHRNVISVPCDEILIFTTTDLHIWQPLVSFFGRKKTRKNSLNLKMLLIRIQIWEQQKNKTKK